MNKRGELYLDGYWQSEKYFKGAVEAIRRELIVQKELEGKNLEIAGMIKEVAQPVSIHIRRGDYVSDKKTNQVHGLCSLDYYESAINRLTETFSSPHFFVFSDDQNWVKENLKLNLPATYVDHNDAATNFEDLRLMSLCKHNIIANSSFSWWGAWLNADSEKVVIAPSKWFADNNMNSQDVCPEVWVRI